MYLIKIDTKHADRKLRDMLEKLSPKQVHLALNRAQNRAAFAGKTIASRSIRNIYKIKKSRVDKRIGVRRANMSNMTAELNVSGEPIPVKEFSYRQGKRGVYVKIGRRRSLIRGAFVATMRNGHTGVFGRGRYVGREFLWRKGRVTRSGGMGAKRRGSDLPITQIHTVSEGPMFAQEPVINPALTRIEEILARRIEHEVAFLVAGL